MYLNKFDECYFSPMLWNTVLTCCKSDHGCFSIWIQLSTRPQSVDRLWLSAFTWTHLDYMQLAVWGPCEINQDVFLFGLLDLPQVSTEKWCREAPLCLAVVWVWLVKATISMARDEWEQSVAVFCDSMSSLSYCKVFKDGRVKDYRLIKPRLRAMWLWDCFLLVFYNVQNLNIHCCRNSLHTEMKVLIISGLIII